MNNNVCPCSSGLAFIECCEKYILGYETAPTALALMRSRYSAYVVKNADYLVATTHESTRNLFSKDEILRWASENQWQKLEIVSFEETIVEFKAFFRGPDAKAYIHHERSTFEKVNGHWYYIDGRAFAFKLVILILCKRHYQKLSVVFDFSISDTFSLGLAS